jgi:hypothetical protein
MEDLPQSESAKYTYTIINNTNNNIFNIIWKF